MTRPKFKTRKILMRGETQVATLLALVPNLPLDPENPIEVVIREQVKVRTLPQQARMWIGPLADIEKQAWLLGRQFSAEAWHEHFKAQFLPEAYDEELTKEGYVKWDIDPAGNRVLIGSTTQLTKKGFAQYLEQVYAAGAGLGVQFGERGEA